MAARATATEFVDLQVQVRHGTGLRQQFPVSFSMPMSYILQPWQLLFVIFASWVHREQQQVIEFYQAQLDALMKAQGKKRLMLSDDQRRLLAVKEECLWKMIFFGPRSLENAVGQYLLHYHGERNHQALANKIIKPAPGVGRTEGEIQCRERLGDLLRYHHRRAA